MSPLELARMFSEKKGIYGQIYRSARFADKEITIDDLTGDFRLCIATPYNERLDKIKFCKGAGEVIKEWYFNTFDEAINFLISNSVV